MKKFISLTLSILILLSLAMPVWAAEGEPPVTGGADQPPVTTTHTHTWETVTTAATCTTAGSKTSTCSGCGEVSTESIPATGHSFGGWTSVDGLNHKHSCSVCGAEETTGHAWGDGTTNVQPGCTTEGQKTYTCSCGAVKTEALSPAGHSYGDWTLTEQTHSRSCTVCGTAESGAHAWVLVETIPATCKEVGANGYGCTICEALLVEEIPKLKEHVYDNGCDTTCNSCGETRVTEHKYNTAWSRNSKEHWHACTICGHKNDVGSHYPGPAATEEKAQLCLTCGLTLTPKLNHTHKYENKLSFDKNGHWYACSGCEVQKDLEEHRFDDACDPDCNDCGYTTNTAHDFDDKWESDESGHWQVCTVCGKPGKEEAHTADPNTPETEAKLCTVCDYEMEPAQEHVHEFEDWDWDEENHWVVCQCEETQALEPHSWDEGTEEDGIITYLCTQCDAQRTEEAPEEGFPWWIMLVVFGLVALGAAAGLVIYFVKQNSGGKYRD